MDDPRQFPSADKIANALRDLRRAPFEIIERYWALDRPWPGEDGRWGALITIARVWCYEGCYGCPPDSLAFLVWVEALSKYEQLALARRWARRNAAVSALRTTAAAP